MSRRRKARAARRAARQDSVTIDIGGGAAITLLGLGPDAYAETVRRINAGMLNDPAVRELITKTRDAIFIATGCDPAEAAADWGPRHDLELLAGIGLSPAWTPGDDQALAQLLESGHA